LIVGIEEHQIQCKHQT